MSRPNCNSYYKFICRDAGMMKTSNCKFIEPSAPVYNIPYYQYVYPGTEYRPDYPYRDMRIYEKKRW